MHDYDPMPDSGATGWSVLLDAFFSIILCSALIAGGCFAMIEVLHLRDRIEAVEEALEEPIEIELLIPDIEPTPAPRRGRDC